MDRKQFTFYESFASAISRIKSKAARCDTYDAICQYALYGREPDIDSLPDAAAIAFELIRPTLDSSKRKAESGSRGGKAEANVKQNESKTKANVKQTAREKEGEKEKEGEIEIEGERENECSPPIIPPQAGEWSKRMRFSPPTVEQVSSYCLERGNSVDAQRFVDFYSAKGWKVGSQPMKDWHAAVRTWERREDVIARKENAKRLPGDGAGKELLKLIEEGVFGD